MDAITYNQTRFGIGTRLAIFPPNGRGSQLLRSFDVEGDVSLSEAELRCVDWKTLSGLVRVFQEARGSRAMTSMENWAR